MREYLIDLNATQAAIRAGYAAASAEVQGSRLLSNDKVAEQVKREMDKRGQRTGITADKVLQEIERMAMYDPKDLVGVNSPEDIALLPEDVRRAIVGWSWDKMGNFLIKLAKQPAIEMLGRHHKLFSDKVEVEVTGLSAILAAIDGKALKPVSDG